MSRSLRFLILNTDYPEFLAWLYSQDPELAGQPYERQMQARIDSLFGVADFYSSNLRKLGHEAWDIHANNEFIQKAWAKEHGNLIEASMWGEHSLQTIFEHCGRVAAKTPLRYLKPLLRPLLRSVDDRPSWVYDVLAAQIKYYKPDVLLNHDMGISSKFLADIKPYVRLLVGQHAATRLPDSQDWDCYDLVVSSFPPTIEYFRKRGIPSELNRLGFEPEVFSYLENGDRAFGITFIGSFHRVHSSREKWLEALCARFSQTKVWSPKIDHLPVRSAIRKCYVGQIWGREMYQVLCRSKITLNHHGDIPPFANNMRLFEATGVGTLLVTDWKPNLDDMFEPGKEVIGYRTLGECADLIQYYLEHDKERETIARAGQLRTLRDHTYFQRVRELVAIIDSHIRRPATTKARVFAGA